MIGDGVRRLLFSSEGPVALSVIDRDLAGAKNTAQSQIVQPSFPHLQFGLDHTFNTVSASTALIESNHEDI